MTLLLHDGRRGGHATWLGETITAGLADGAILNPFATPPTTIPRHPSAKTVIADLRGGQLLGSAAAEILFDSATWAATLPGTDFWQVYDQWDLWRTTPVATCAMLAQSRITSAQYSRSSPTWKFHTWRRRWPSMLRQGRRLRRRWNSLPRPADNSRAAQSLSAARTRSGGGGSLTRRLHWPACSPSLYRVLRHPLAGSSGLSGRPD